MPRSQKETDAVLKQLREFGLTYPGAHFKSPWPGHMDLAVNDKTFAYLGLEGEPFRISCKLPKSNGMALMLPFSKPAGYGLGKSGWVEAHFPDDQPLPVDMLKAWIDESYRAQAPKKLVAALDARGPAAAEPAKPVAAAAKKVAAKVRARAASPRGSGTGRKTSGARGARGAAKR